MKLPQFEYAGPTSVAEAVALLAAGNGMARPISGGQSLVPLLAFRLTSPSLLVDLRGVAELEGIRIDANGVRLGARVRWCDILSNAELKAAQPDGVRYLTLRLEDDTFVHIVETDAEDGSSAIPKLAAFQAFQSGIRDRCAEPPLVRGATIVDPAEART